MFGINPNQARLLVPGPENLVEYGALRRRSGSLETPTEFSHAPQDVPLQRYAASDGEMEDSKSVDQFSELLEQQLAKKITRTGRQRKKLAARTKGGEFQAKKRKKRLYFCCISNEINLEGLNDTVKLMARGWECKMFEDVLHIYIGGEQSTGGDTVDTPYGPGDIYDSILRSDGGSSPSLMNTRFLSQDLSVEDTHSDSQQSAATLWKGAKEVFVFEFGVAVFWGFHRGEEDQILEIIRLKYAKNVLSTEEFPEGQDDMAFIATSETEGIKIANDVITMNETTSAKSRLAVSFAIAQSAVLAIFEARIEHRIKEYKYIPETLAVSYIPSNFHLLA